MKKIFYTSILLIVVSLGLELKAQSVTYRVTKDDPFDVKNLTIAIDPLFFDVSGDNGYAFGWGARANWFMGKALDFNFDMRTGFGTRGYDIDNNNTRNYFAMEGSVAVTLSHKVRTHNVPIILSSSSYTSGGYTYTTTYSISGGVPADTRKVIAFRAGAYQMTNAYDLNKNLHDSLLMFKNKDTGSEFTQKENKDTIAMAASDRNFWGGISSTAVFAGFNFKTIRQLVVDVDGWGVRQNSRYSDFFIDGIFSPAIALKNYRGTGVGVLNAGKETKYDLKYEGGKRAFGWRVGWSYRKPKDQGFSFKWEFGQRPGFKTVNEKNSSINFRNWYTMLTYGLYIPLKVKPVATAE